MTTDPPPFIHKFVKLGDDIFATGRGEILAVKAPIDEHPPLVAVTVYVPGDEIGIDDDVPPVFHKYDENPLVLKVALPPGQRNPLIVMIGGLIGNNVNVAVTSRFVAHIDMVQVKVKVPAILFHCMEILGLP